MSRDGFYESFWATPEVPTPQMKADLPKHHALADARLKLKSRLKLLDVAREGDLISAIESCRLYCQQLCAEEFSSSPAVLCRWKSSFTSEPMDIPCIFELPMVLSTRAVLLLNRAKCVSRARDREKVPQAVAFCLEAAGIFDYILELMNAHLMDGIEAPSSLPDLSLDVLQSLQGVCLAIAQQLSIVKAVLHFDRPYSKSVLVKLHGGCQASFQLFEATLVRNCALSSSSGAMNVTVPCRDAKTLLSFASFFGRLHKAQVFLLSAELEHETHRIGPAIVYAKIAKTLFQDRTSIGGLGLPPLTDSVAVERIIGPLLATKRAAVDQLHADYTKENDSIYFESVPDHDATLLSATLSQAFIMKPQVFDLNKDTREENGEESTATSTKQEEEEQQPRHPQMTTDNGVERIQVIAERDEMNNTPSAPAAADGDFEPGQSVHTLPSDDAVSNGPADFASMRRSIITELSDIMFTTNASEISPTNVVATRRRSERPPSMILAQREANSSPRKKSAKYATSMAVPRPPDVATALENFQQQLASSAITTLQPCATGSGKSPTKLNVVQPEVQVTNSSAEEQMRGQLAKGKPILRLSKDTRWKKETMYLMNDEIVFIRKKPLLFSTQKRAAWSAIQAVQLEEGSAMKDAMHFILIVAKHGESDLTPFEFTANPPGETQALFSYLHRVFQERRKKSVQPTASFRPLQRQHTIA
uniref:BRO1 domain-containing protein n=1 Tax=Globisporangium ultimum (strain ATCC 200006 / CBS 805.95 / DAOM BR144) TaxID=431595 RepID=K3X5X5_GLOUD